MCLKVRYPTCVFIVGMSIVEELAAKARRFHILAGMTSDVVMKERLIALGNDYLEQADEINRQRTIIQAVYPKSVAQ